MSPVGSVCSWQWVFSTEESKQKPKHLTSIALNQSWVIQNGGTLNSFKKNQIIQHYFFILCHSNCQVWQMIIKQAMLISLASMLTLASESALYNSQKILNISILFISSVTM